MRSAGRAPPIRAAAGHDEKEQTLNQLLVELDGFDPGKGVVLLAATNRPEILDPALLRAGRFDRQVLVDRPDKIGPHPDPDGALRKAKLATDVDPEQVAALTPGFTGADLANLVNEAAPAGDAARCRVGRDCATSTHAIERIVAGLEKKNRLLISARAQDRRLSRARPCLDRDGAARQRHGAQGLEHSARHRRARLPIQRPTEDRFLMTRDELENKMCVLLGGRAAEQLVFGHLSTGAADDLAKVTDNRAQHGDALRHGIDARPGGPTIPSGRRFSAKA